MYLLQTLRSAGIKFWMLTGDKYSTALQIATACNLKSSDERTLLCSVEVPYTLDNSRYRCVCAAVQRD